MTGWQQGYVNLALGSFTAWWAAAVAREDGIGTSHINVNPNNLPA